MKANGSRPCFPCPIMVLLIEHHLFQSCAICVAIPICQPKSPQINISSSKDWKIFKTKLKQVGTVGTLTTSFIFASTMKQNTCLSMVHQRIISLSCSRQNTRDCYCLRSMVETHLLIEAYKFVTVPRGNTTKRIPHSPKKKKIAA